MYEVIFFSVWLCVTVLTAKKEYRSHVRRKKVRRRMFEPKKYEIYVKLRIYDTEEFPLLLFLLSIGSKEYAGS
jgi:hypothetical protein